MLILALFVIGKKYWKPPKCLKVEIIIHHGLSASWNTAKFIKSVFSKTI